MNANCAVNAKYLINATPSQNAMWNAPVLLLVPQWFALETIEADWLVAYGTIATMCIVRDNTYHYLPNQTLF